MTVHQIKIRNEYYIPIITGDKTATIRRNDRDYQTGDILQGYFIEKDGTYTGEVISLNVTHIISDCLGLEDGFVIMSYKIFSHYHDKDLENLEISKFKMTDYKITGVDYARYPDFCTRH